MLIEEEINDLVFVEQRTYYVYRNKEDQSKDKWMITTSDEITFNEFKAANLKIQELKQKYL